MSSRKAVVWSSNHATYNCNLDNEMTKTIVINSGQMVPAKREAIVQLHAISDDKGLYDTTQYMNYKKLVYIFQKLRNGEYSF